MLCLPVSRLRLNSAQWLLGRESNPSFQREWMKLPPPHPLRHHVMPILKWPSPWRPFFLRPLLWLVVWSISVRHSIPPLIRLLRLPHSLLHDSNFPQPIFASRFSCQRSWQQNSSILQISGIVSAKPHYIALYRRQSNRQKTTETVWYDVLSSLYLPFIYYKWGVLKMQDLYIYCRWRREVRACIKTPTSREPNI